MNVGGEAVRAGAVSLGGDDSPDGRAGLGPGPLPEFPGGAVDLNVLYVTMAAVPLTRDDRVKVFLALSGFLEPVARELRGEVAHGCKAGDEVD